MDFDTIFLAGPQGAGKGTQGTRLAQKLGFFFWDTGAILREMSRLDTPLGKKLGVIHQGILLTDDVIIEVIKEKFSSIPQGKGIIFDGVPRRIGQAQFLIQFLKDKGHKRPVTLFIDLPREESIARLLARAKHEKRDDDYRGGIETRLRAYEEATKPMLEHLKTETTFLTVDGRPSIDEVAKEIDAALGIA